MDHRSVLCAFGLMAVLASPACSADTSADDDADEESSALTAGSASDIDIGFNIGWGDQFDYYPDFFDKGPPQKGKRICHTYTSWRVGYEGKPDPSLVNNDAPHGSRAALTYFFQKAKGHCDEALISFKATSNRVAPSEDDYTAAMNKFFDVPWKDLTGFDGDLAFTPWNEPNNKADDGNGLGVQIHPDLAARYYLNLAAICKANSCKVAAGDFATNGDMWNDLEINCQNDNVQDLCSKKSSWNKTNAGPSYLDIYKNTIALKSGDYYLKDRPDYFAFHGWHDINMYLKDSWHCTAYDNCAERRVLQSLGGSWGGVEIWDTETGVDQSSTDQITDSAQACGSAFLLRLHAISKRITRIYYTRLHGGGGQLFRDGHKARDAVAVLQSRTTNYTKADCK